VSWSSEPLIIEPVDLNALEGAIAEALQGKDTHVFLDTNILIWLFKPHAAARSEFLEWLDTLSRDNRVHIPRRAIHEFSRYRGDSNVLFGNGAARKITRQVEQFAAVANLIVGDAQAIRNGFVDRAQYTAELKSFQDMAKRVFKPVEASERLEEIEALLIPRLNALALKEDIFQDIDRLRREYEARAEIRIPPGFADSRKGNRQATEKLQDDEPVMSGANRFGDFAIWEEILQFCTGKNAIKGVVILSHDQKPDWCYKPRSVIDLDGRRKAADSLEYKLTIAHPMLAHEARVRAGIQKLHTVTIPQFARIAVRHSFAVSMTALAHAVQIEASEVGTGEEVDEMASAPSSPPSTGPSSLPAPSSGNQSATTAATRAGPAAASPTTLASFLANLPSAADADRTYVSDPSGPALLDDAIQRLKTINWYIQNPAAEAGVALLNHAQGTLMQAFIFGRNIYQAACGSAIVPGRILADLTRELSAASDDMLGVVYAGAVFEAYFDGNGAIRERPKGDQIANLFRHQTVPKMKITVDWIRKRLRSVEEHYLLLPDTKPPVRKFDVRLDGSGTVIGISAGGVVLTEPFVGNGEVYPLPPSISRTSLSKKLADFFAIPEAQIDIQPVLPTSARTPVGNLQLKEWGPKTNLRFAPP
jgi:predicted nucleic acid-binding protein